MEEEVSVQVFEYDDIISDQEHLDLLLQAGDVEGYPCSVFHICVGYLRQFLPQVWRYHQGNQFRGWHHCC